MRRVVLIRRLVARVLPPSLAALACAYLSNACNSSARSQDDSLIEKVRTAAQQMVPPSEVDGVVREPSWLNTSRGVRDRKVLADAAIYIDPSRSSDALTLQGQDVAYWGRPIDAKD